MTRLRALAITAIVLAAHGLLVPSCVRWNIGQNIRESTERHVGINPGEAYVLGEGEDRITIARELSYELDTPLIAFLDEPPLAQDIRMGEHFREVKISRSKQYSLKTTVGARYEPNGQPLESCRKRMTGVRLTPASMGSSEVQYSDSHRLATLAAIPFDCCIDPVLSVISTAAALPFTGVAAVVLFSYCAIDSL